MEDILSNDYFEVKKLIIKSLFADDDLMDIFVLKGGNALSIIYKVNNRASVDIDVSMEKDFSDYNFKLEDIENKTQKAFQTIFSSSDYIAFDFKWEKKPNKKNFEAIPSWGGYCLEFKIIEKEKFDKTNIELSRKMALKLGKKGTKYTVDVSRYEYVKDKNEVLLDNMDIFVYSPLMIINEKLRAICQQMEEYKMSIKKKSRPRDFFDIYNVFQISPEIEEQFLSDDNKENIKNVFNSKNVPLILLNKIKDTYEFHSLGFSSLENTVEIHTDLKEFEFYFNFILEKIDSLNSFWEK